MRLVVLFGYRYCSVGRYEIFVLEVENALVFALLKTHSHLILFSDIPPCRISVYAVIFGAMALFLYQEKHRTLGMASESNANA